MGWKLFQTAIVLAVIFSNVHYDWAHGTSGLAVVVVAVAAAWIATALLVLAGRLKTLLLGGHQGVHQRRP